ncbi:protein translocase subunit SecF, partial [candidate division WWE3 bacterium CG10_big_fil_rev_8_21_14_0_10_39_14]
MSISMQTINFMKHKLLYLAISSLVIVPGIISLFVWGLKPAIDFTGGSLWEIRFNEQVSLSELGDNFQNSGDNQFLVRLKPTSEEEKNKMGEELERKFGKFEEIRFETVGPTLGKELLVKTLIAVLLAAGAILSYVGWRFKNKMYGLCAIIAMFHDTLVLIGTFSLLGHFFGVEVDTLFVTAVLTTLS